MEIRDRAGPRTTRHPAWISRVKARARDNRGVAIIEAAFITPVFFILVLGIVEVGLAMNDNLALGNAVRAGSRAASASGNDAKADMYTLLRIGKEASAVDGGSINHIVIYKPATFGEGPTDACKGGLSVANVCNAYSMADVTAATVQVKEETEALAAGRPVDQSKIVFGCAKVDSPDKPWCPTDRKVTVGGTGPEYVGVWMSLDHAWVTKMFGESITLTDQSVIRLEPRLK